MQFRAAVALFVAPLSLWVHVRAWNCFDAHEEMKRLGDAVRDYRECSGRLPDDFGTVTFWFRFMPGSTIDPWGTPYRYRSGGPYEFVISSAGPDLAWNTNDDLRHPGP